MKKILIAGYSILSMHFADAQQKQGKVIYEHTVQRQVNFQGANDEMERMVPQTLKDKFELVFGNNQSLWKAAEPGNENDNTFGSEGGGMQMRIVAIGDNDVLYNNFETGKKVEQREIFDKKFIVDDSIRPLKWKMTGETKNILNHKCMKATAEQISQRMRMTMDNGKMERKEITDTSTIIAWFASDIPISAGPAEYQGQLPGLILEMEVANGRQTFKAIEISEKADLAVIKEPQGKKHYTPEEFNKERNKMMDEMQRNNGGGNRVIHIN
jgi:GLPGLI family protein